jgi:UDP-GlcNAc:undecaprenyl-phosphate GlcNAc-1-phosphate transferase
LNPLVPSAIAATLAAIVTNLSAPFAMRLAHRIGALDHPDEEPGGLKKHRTAIPHLGSVAIFAGTLTGSLLLLTVPASNPPDLPTRFPAPNPSFAAAVLIALALGIIGMIDDFRPLSSPLRLLVQIAAALGAWEIGFRVMATSSRPLNIALTIVWIVGITNAFNLLDNMDGLSSGLIGIGALSFSVMGIIGMLPPLAVIAAALAGAAFGFWPRNRYPARIFMGDGGALFCGFLLAIIGIEIRFDNLVQVTFLVPVVVLGLPIFDTTLVVLSRLRRGQRPFTGGRDHVSHRLVRMGFPVKTAVGLLFWCGLCLGWLGLVISRATVEVGWMLLGFVFAIGIYFGRLLWSVPADDVQGAHEPQTGSEDAPAR